MRAALALLASAVAAHAAPPCPIDAPALARLRSEHAQMNAAGLACLQALDGARSERDRCNVAAATAADACARDLATAAASLDAAQAALAAPVPEPAQRRPWALVGFGGLAAAGAAGAAVAFDAGALEAAGAGIGAALVAAGVVAIVAWALN
jgi:hypothetical protein